MGVYNKLYKYDESSLTSRVEARQEGKYKYTVSLPPTYIHVIKMKSYAASTFNCIPQIPYLGSVLCVPSMIPERLFEN